MVVGVPVVNTQVQTRQVEETGGTWPVVFIAMEGASSETMVQLPG